MSESKQRPLLGLVMLGFAALSAGCTQSNQVEFASRNAQSDLDLNGIVRGQSNELLNMAVDLETSAKNNFPAPKRLRRTLNDAIAQSDQVSLNLPSLLAAQDVELADLRAQVSDGTAGKTTLKERESAIQTYRKALIGSLDGSAKRAAYTAQTLQASTQPGLGEQAQIAQDLAQDLKDARTMIAMQL